MLLGEKIKKLRKEKRLTQSGLAKILDVAPTAVSAWERNANKPLMDKLSVMAELFEVPISHFFEKEMESNVEEIELPVYGEIACGNGTVIFEDTTEYKTVPRDWVKGGKYFFTRAVGDSMIGARIQDGDLLLIREQPQISNGEIAAVCVDGEMLLKKVYYQKGQIVLQSENSKYPPKVLDSDDKSVRIVGKLVKLLIDF